MGVQHPGFEEAAKLRRVGAGLQVKQKLPCQGARAWLRCVGSFEGAEAHFQVVIYAPEIGEQRLLEGPVQRATQGRAL